MRLRVLWDDVVMTQFDLNALKANLGSDATGKDEDFEVNVRTLNALREMRGVERVADDLDAAEMARSLRALLAEHVEDAQGYTGGGVYTVQELHFLRVWWLLMKGWGAPLVDTVKMGGDTRGRQVYEVYSVVEADED